jgi:hypothetical protein
MSTFFQVAVIVTRAVFGDVSTGAKKRMHVVVRYRVWFGSHRFPARFFPLSTKDRAGTPLFSGDFFKFAS